MNDSSSGDQRECTSGSKHYISRTMGRSPMGPSGRHTIHTENMPSKAPRHPVKSEQGAHAVIYKSENDSVHVVIRGHGGQTRPLPVRRDRKRRKMQERHKALLGTEDKHRSTICLVFKVAVPCPSPLAFHSGPMIRPVKHIQSFLEEKSSSTEASFAYVF